MKRIFEDAGQIIPASVCQERSVQYTQLSCNAQRPSPREIEQHEDVVHNIAEEPYHGHELERGSILGIENLHSEPASASEQTVDSWSDDSGYILTKSRLPPLATRPSTRQIQRWLSDVSPDQSTVEAESSEFSGTQLATSAELHHSGSHVRADAGAAEPSGILGFIDRECVHREPVSKENQVGRRGTKCSTLLIRDLK